jgi:hypothetical protein
MNIDLTDHSDNDAPTVPARPTRPPAIDGPSRILRRDRLGGLIHEYTQVA